MVSRSNKYGNNHYKVITTLSKIQHILCCNNHRLTCIIKAKSLSLQARGRSYKITLRLEVCFILIFMVSHLKFKAISPNQISMSLKIQTGILGISRVFDPRPVPLNLGPNRTANTVHCLFWRWTCGQRAHWDVSQDLRKGAKFSMGVNVDWEKYLQHIGKSPAISRVLCRMPCNSAGVDLPSSGFVCKRTWVPWLLSGLTGFIKLNCPSKVTYWKSGLGAEQINRASCWR